MSDQKDSSLTLLYLEKRPELVRFFTARAGSAAAAEDIVQELYFKVMHVDEAEIRNELGFLYRLGLNLMIDRLRSEGRARARERDYVGGDDVEVKDESPTPEDVIISRERMRGVLRAIEDLPPQCRRVFRMHRFDGMSQSDIAKQLGISQRVVEKHVSNALRRLVEATK